MLYVLDGCEALVLSLRQSHGAQHEVEAKHTCRPEGVAHEGTRVHTGGGKLRLMGGRSEPGKIRLTEESGTKPEEDMTDL